MDEYITSTISESTDVIENTHINNADKTIKHKSSAIITIFLILLIIVLLAGNVVSIFLLTKKDSSKSIADIELSVEYIDSVSNNINLFDAAGLVKIEIDEKYGFIDKNGTVVIEPQFDSASMFSDGLAIVSTDDKYGIIDAKGKYIINPTYDAIAEFSNGLSAVKKDDKFGYIDKTGKIVIPINYGHAYSFTNDGYAYVITENKQLAIIDTEGKIIYSQDYSDELCKKPNCFEHTSSDTQYCYEHKTETCKWSGCTKEAKYGDYCFNHYYALED